MFLCDVPEDILAKAFIAFNAEGREKDYATRLVEQEIIERLISNDPKIKMQYDEARAFLSDQSKVDLYIEKTRNDLNAVTEVQQKNITKKTKKLKDELHAEMKAELEDCGIGVGDIEKEWNATPKIIQYIAISIMKLRKFKYLVVAAVALNIMGSKGSNAFDYALDKSVGRHAKNIESLTDVPDMFWTPKYLEGGSAAAPPNPNFMKIVNEVDRVMKEDKNCVCPVQPSRKIPNRERRQLKF